MIDENNSYCKVCGKKHPIILLNFFDSKTGVRIQDNSMCYNPDCKIGKQNICYRDGGHDGGKWLKRTFCKKCGATLDWSI